MPRIFVNGESRQVTTGTSVKDLLDTIELTGKRLAVEVDGCIVPRSEHPQHQLEQGARVEIVEAIGGG